MSFKSNLALVKGPSHSEAMFERAHPGFNASSPALATPKPTRLLAFGASGAQTAPARQDNVFDSQGAGGAFVGRIPEASICSGQLRSLPENAGMRLDRGNPL